MSNDQRDDEQGLCRLSDKIKRTLGDIEENHAVLLEAIAYESSERQKFLNEYRLIQSRVIVPCLEKVAAMKSTSVKAVIIPGYHGVSFFTTFGDGDPNQLSFSADYRKRWVDIAVDCENQESVDLSSLNAEEVYRVVIKFLEKYSLR